MIENKEILIEKNEELIDINTHLDSLSGNKIPEACYCKNGRECDGQILSNNLCMSICPIRSNSMEEVTCDPKCKYCQVQPSGYSCSKFHKRTCFDSSVGDKDIINGVVNLPEIPKCLL